MRGKKEFFRASQYVWYLQYDELRIKQPTKESWKSTVKEAVNKYWTESLKNEAYEKSSLRYLNIDSMKMGETYSVWKSLDSIVSDVRKATIKCRMLTITYMLQSASHKFSRANVSATCKCCGLYDEDLAHMLLECPAFIHQKKPIYSQFKTKVINCIGAQHWRELFNNRDSLVKLILGCSRYSIIKEKPELLNTSADLIYRLHVTRINKVSLE